ncbi:MAG: trimeric intracellular cation channel family protein [Hungatella sp.]|jgi:uncharacterized membrane protein YeiH|nr:trimeric intracellular cation channel family protein [Hungatella sp.]
MIFILELIGTIAFAFSGCMVANSKRMDIFGVWVLGTVTAVGGGAVRDVLLGQFPPNMFRDGVYVAAATATVVFWLWMAAKKGALPRRHFHQLTQVMDISDSIGLGVFAVVGSQTAIRCGYGGNWFLVIFVGVLTGVGGGLMRDVMANMTPMIFRKRIYASAAMAGSIVYVVLLSLVPEIDAILAGIATVFAIRTMASLRHWDLPVYVLEPEDQEQDS